MRRTISTVVALTLLLGVFGCAHQATKNLDTLPSKQNVAADAPAHQDDSRVNFVDIAEAFLGLLFHAFMELPIILIWVP